MSSVHVNPVNLGQLWILFSSLAGGIPPVVLVVELKDSIVHGWTFCIILHVQLMFSVLFCLWVFTFALGTWWSQLWTFDFTFWIFLNIQHLPVKCFKINILAKCHTETKWRSNEKHQNKTVNVYNAISTWLFGGECDLGSNIWKESNF